VHETPTDKYYDLLLMTVFPTLSKKRICFVTVLTLFPSLLLVSRQGPERLPERVIVSETAPASCYDQANEKLVGSMLVRSQVFVSPDGKYQAYTENEAVARQGLGLADCVNTAKLFVKETSEDGFRLVFLQEPTLYELFNDIKVVDWSPDSRYLLVRLFVGQWGSDAGGGIPLRYDAWDGVFSPRDMVTTAFQGYLGHDCDYGEQTLGFSPEGAVVLKVYPNFDEAGTPDPASCVKKEWLWLLSTQGIFPLPDTYKVLRYGRLLRSGQSN